MPTVYATQNAIDARLVYDLLEAAGLAPRLTGESLQGGVGEVPPLGLIRVEVPDHRVDAARALVAEWEARVPTPEDDQALEAAALATPQRPEPFAPTGLRALGALLGLLIALFLFAVLH